MRNCEECRLLAVAGKKRCIARKLQTENTHFRMRKSPNLTKSTYGKELRIGELTSQQMKTIYYSKFNV